MDFDAKAWGRDLNARAQRARVRMGRECQVVLFEVFSLLSRIEFDIVIEALSKQIHQRLYTLCVSLIHIARLFKFPGQY